MAIRIAVLGAPSPAEATRDGVRDQQPERPGGSAGDLR